MPALRSAIQLQTKQRMTRTRAVLCRTFLADILPVAFSRSPWLTKQLLRHTFAWPTFAWPQHVKVPSTI